MLLSFVMKQIEISTQQHLLHESPNEMLLQMLAIVIMSEE